MLKETCPTCKGAGEVPIDFKVYGKYEFKHKGETLVGSFYGTTTQSGHMQMLTPGHGVLWIMPRYIIKEVSKHGNQKSHARRSG